MRFFKLLGLLLILGGIAIGAALTLKSWYKAPTHSALVTADLPH
jgi:hypothetical protein